MNPRRIPELTLFGGGAVMVSAAVLLGTYHILLASYAVGLVEFMTALIFLGTIWMLFGAGIGVLLYDVSTNTRGVPS